ncbi:hypothetical protein [Streptomyces spinosirectus]
MKESTTAARAEDNNGRMPLRLSGGDSDAALAARAVQPCGGRGLVVDDEAVSLTTVLLPYSDCRAVVAGGRGKASARHNSGPMDQGLTATVVDSV